MTQIKLKHYFLFFLAFFVFIGFKISGGALFLFLAMQQMFIYVDKNSLTTAKQVATLFHTLFFLPLLVFISSVLSFNLIYLHEQQLGFFISSSLISLILLFGLISINYLFLEAVLKADKSQVANVIFRNGYRNLSSGIKEKKLAFIKLTFLTYFTQLLISIIPFLNQIESRIILSLFLTQIIYQHLKLKPANAD